MPHSDKPPVSRARETRKHGLKGGHTPTPIPSGSAER